MANGPALRAPRSWLSMCGVAPVLSVAVALLASCASPPAAAPTSASPASASSSTAPTSSSRPDHPLPDPAALLKQSSSATTKLTSAHLVLTVTGTLAQMPVNALEADLANQHGAPAARGNAKITMMGADVDVRFVVFERRLYMALPQADWRDYGPTSSVYDVAALLNPQTGLANLLAEFIDPKAEARETVDGNQTVRISGKVTAEAVNKLVPLDVSKRTLCTVWIQESDEHQLVRVKLEPGNDDAVQIVLSGWNVPVSVEKPAGR